jgi:hypothetical protein
MRLLSASKVNTTPIEIFEILNEWPKVVSLIRLLKSANTIVYRVPKPTRFDIRGAGAAKPRKRSRHSSVMPASRGITCGFSRVGLV